MHPGAEEFTGELRAEICIAQNIRLTKAIRDEKAK